MENHGVTTLWIENLAKDIVEHIVVGLQPGRLAISLVTI
jgi:hypothetical protein